MEARNKIKIGLIISAVVIALVALIASISFATELESGTRVEEGSDLTYYITVNYDGKDANAESSSDEATADVYSDYIYVEDKLPEGLTFKEFVKTDDNSIGATQRSSGSYCAGYVVDGVDGLFYDTDTRTVSFKVKNLQAGCQITVGVVTEVPYLSSYENTNRMDFYNNAYGREGGSTVTSNTVHVFIGRETVQTYTVVYEYDGEVPDGAPEVPETQSYAAGSTVGVAADVTVEGYEFSGWSTSDVTVNEDGTFTMPADIVTFTGSFTAIPEESKHKVTYEIEGDAPDGFEVPTEKEYYAGADVKLDSLRAGDEVNGYRFLGWEIKEGGVTLPADEDDEDIIFTMPENDVVIVGKFERISYTVTYAFQGTVLPPGYESLLPATKSYYPGDTVTLEDVSSEPEGYSFLGWYYADEFTMPAEDVVIYGEWMIETGTFQPTIEKSITDYKESYQKGETVRFEIKVTNTAEFTITDVILEEQTDGCYFVAGDGYTLRNSTYVLIDSIGVGESVTVYAEYEVGDDVVKNITNVVELTGALASDNYSLDTSVEYKAEATFTVANISLTINKMNEESQTLSGAEFTLYSDGSLQNSISTGLTFTGLSPSTTYYLKETKAPTGYQILGNTLTVVVDETGNITIEGYDVNTDNGASSVSIVNYAINILPETGREGIIPYILVGLFLVVDGVICIVVISRKRSGKHEKANK